MPVSFDTGIPEKKVNMNYSGIIFDLDGVICFTDELHYLAWKRIADEEGIFFDRKINDRLRGVSRTDSLEIILEKANRKYSVKEKSALCAKKNDIYVGLLNKLDKKNVPDETRNVLNVLRGVKIKTAIGSSSKNAKLILQKTEMTKYFDAIVDGNTVSHSKPHPEVFIKAVELLGEKPCECLVVEDASAGIEAACRGGFDSAGIGEAAKCDKATYSIANLKELIKIAGA